MTCRLVLSLLVVWVLAGCASAPHPRLTVEAMHIEDTWRHTPGCQQSIKQADAFDDKRLERTAQRIGLSAILGPLSWPIHWWRDKQHAQQRDAVVSLAKRSCQGVVDQ